MSWIGTAYESLLQRSVRTGTNCLLYLIFSSGAIVSMPIYWEGLAGATTLDFSGAGIVFLSYDIRCHSLPTTKRHLPSLLNECSDLAYHTSFFLWMAYKARVVWQSLSGLLKFSAWDFQDRPVEMLCLYENAMFFKASLRLGFFKRDTYLTARFVLSTVIHKLLQTAWFMFVYEDCT